jgi:hypothetical protein
MKLKTIAAGLVCALGGAFIVLACGSDPKPDPATPAPSTSVSPDAVTPPSTASATPAAASASAAPAVDPKVADCEKLRDDANETLDAKRIEVNKDCKKDADCVPIKGRACGFDCVNAAIPKSLEKNWNEAVSKVKDGQCKKWDANECAKLKTRPAPTCKDQKVACDKGSCVLKDK